MYGSSTIWSPIVAVRGFALRMATMMTDAKAVHMCRSCLSGNRSQFSSEICIHFPGLEGLEKPAVFVFPKIVVCFNCGHSEFSMPETELRSLVNCLVTQQKAVPFLPPQVIFLLTKTSSLRTVSMAGKSSLPASDFRTNPFRSV